MNCPKCGASVKRGQQFCSKCGASIPQEQPAAVPGAEYLPGYCRWLWTILYRLAEYSMRLNISCSDKAIRKVMRKRVGIFLTNAVLIVAWFLLAMSILSSISFIMALFRGRASFSDLLVILCLCLIAAVYFSFHKAEKAMVDSTDLDERILISLATKLLYIPILFMMYVTVLFSDDVSAFYVVAYALFLISLYFYIVFQHKAQRRGIEMENAIPGWLGIFRAKGEARGPEGERYVDENLSIWCRAHPVFRLVDKDCVSKYSNHCIRLGKHGSPIEPQEFDHILVGPGIVVHIETKAYGGQITIVNEDQWQRWNKGTKKWEPLESPHNQARRHDLLLRSIVGSDVQVVPLICMADATVQMKQTENMGDIDMVGIAYLQESLSVLYSQLFDGYEPGAAEYAETQQLLNLLNSHKVGRMNV